GRRRATPALNGHTLGAEQRAARRAVARGEAELPYFARRPPQDRTALRGGSQVDPTPTPPPPHAILGHPWKPRPAESGHAWPRGRKSKWISSPKRPPQVKPADSHAWPARS